MSVPHSAVHAASYDGVQKHGGTTEIPEKKKGGGMVSKDEAVRASFDISRIPASYTLW